MRGIVVTVLLLVAGVAAPAAPVTISGRVMDEQGAVVAGAQVWLIRHVFQPWQRETHLEVETQTDAHGLFSLPDVELPLDDLNSQLAVAAYRPGLALGWLTVKGQTQGLEITLLRPAPVTGQVSSEDGGGLGAVKVQPRFMTWVSLLFRGYLMLPDALRERLAVTSDDQGNFTLLCVPLDARIGAALLAPGYVTVRSSPPEDKPWVVRYPPAGTIEGRVVCEEEPQQAAEVGIRVGGGIGEFFVDAKVVSDAQGHFELSGLPAGEYTITVQRGAQSPWQTYPKGKVVVTGDATTEVELVLQEATPVQGRVVEEGTGAPVAGVMVTLDTSTGYPQLDTVSTDEGGSYLVYALPGKATVRMYTVPEEYVRPGYTRRSKQIEVHAFELPGPDFELKHGVSLVGTVVDTQRQPVKAAEVFYSATVPRPEGGPMEVPGPGAGPGASRSTDEQGLFTIKQLDPDSVVTLRARAGDLMSREETRVTLKEQTEPVVLTVHPDVGVTLTGTVVDDRGQPIEEAEVTIHWRAPGWGRSVARLHTDAQGRFRNEPQFPMHSYYARASAPGHAPGQGEQWAAAPGQTHEFGPLVLIAARGVVTGQVVDRQGNPLSDAQVYNRGDGLKDISTTTDVEGRFMLEGLFEGPVWVFAEAEGYQFGGAATEASSDDVLITLSPPEETLQLGPPLPMPRTVDVEKDHEVALQLINEALAILEQRGPGGDDYLRRSLISRLGLLNTRRALALSAEAEGRYDQHIYRTLGQYLIYDRPDQGLTYLDKTVDPQRRAYLSRWAAERLLESDPQRARELLNYALGESLLLQEVKYQAAYLAHTAEVLWKLDPDAAVLYLRKAAELADQLTYSGWDVYARGVAAETLSRIDLPAALELLDTIKGLVDEDPADVTYAGAYSRHLRNIAFRVAATDPARAEKLLASLDERGYTQAVRAVCYQMAATDPDRALRLARSLKDPDPYGWPGQRALALGSIAHALAATDSERAISLIQEAAEYLSEYRSSSDYPRRYAGHYGLASACAILVQIAAEIGYPRVDELVLRALSLRSGPVQSYSPDLGAEENAELAMRLAFVDPQTARRLLEGYLVRPSLVRPGYMYLGDALTAAAIIDPDLAAEMVRQIAESGQYGPGTMQPGPRADDEPERLRLQAYQTVIEYLTIHPSRRRIEVMSRYGFWLPGAEHE